MLSNKEKYRYDRQIKLASFGESAQEKIKAASVLVIGAGGLGCPALLYLAGSGVGKIGIVDFDSINETNLHRQILFNEKDIGNNKAFVAAEKIKLLNSNTEIECFPKKLDNQLAIDLIARYDVILDATDNFSSRYLINDTSVLYGKPFVYGSVYKTEGQISVFNYRGGPSYRYLYPAPPSFAPACDEVGVLNTLCGIVGIKQAQEVIKLITQTGEVLSGKIECLDALRNTSYLFEVYPDSQRKTFSQAEILSTDYAFFCGEQSDKTSISTEEFKNLLNKQNMRILDIRQNWEEPKLTFPNVIEIPLQHIEEAAQQINPNEKVIVVCKYGTRSAIAVEYLRSKHHFVDVANLKGGLFMLSEVTD